MNPASPPRCGDFRVSLACIECRTRHVRCDAEKPQCSRCAARRKQCHYAESRRGGLTRAAKAARRNLVATGLRSASLERIFEATFPFPEGGPFLEAGRDHVLSLDNNSISQTQTDQHISLDLSRPCGIKAATNSSLEECLAIRGDPYIDQYYKHFHRYHPCVLPRGCLEKLLEDTTRQTSLKPLVSVMRFIGALYARSDSHQLGEEAISVCIPTEPCSRDPFTVQYHLIYSIALYWCGEREPSREEMDRAIELALELKMHRQEFAVKHGHGDPVLEESWRRTWWQLYVVDSWYAAMKRVLTYPTLEVDATVDLPCDEKEYESGAIPPPKTLEDFDFREFSAHQHVYSSFAYLISVTRDLSTVRTGPQLNTSNDASSKVLETIDAVIEGWLLLLPESKRHILSKNGDFDEVMFQANMAIHAATVATHRQFSELAFNPLERISSCAPKPPDRCAWPAADGETIHTARCLKSIEAQIRLLALPSQPSAHSPFVVCMLATGTISLLSACKFLLTGHKLAVARQQIKMSIGYIKSFSSVWSQAGTTLQEIQTIAREVLEQPSKDQHGVRLSEALPPDYSRQLPLSSALDIPQELGAYALSTPLVDNHHTDFHLTDIHADTTWLSGY